MKTKKQKIKAKKRTTQLFGLSFDAEREGFEPPDL